MKRSATNKIPFTRLRDGRYVQPESGIELVKGIDDSDGYDRIEWQVWTPQMGRPLGLRDTLHEAKAAAREFLAANPSRFDEIDSTDYIKTPVPDSRPRRRAR